MRVRNLTKYYLENNYGKQLTAQEVVEYKERLVKFFALLMEIDQKNRKKNNENKNN